MKKYLGVKIVSAELMFSQKAFREGLVRADHVANNQEGYKVVYEDGYASWSPKEVFEKAYKEVEEPEDVFVPLVVDMRKGVWTRLRQEEPLEQPESLSRTDLLKQFALSQAANAKGNASQEVILDHAKAYFDFLSK